MPESVTIKSSAIEQFFSRSGAFSTLSQKHLRLLARLVKIRHLEAEEVLWRQGQQITHFIIVLNGRLRSVRLSVGGQEKLLSYLPLGYHFGLAEMITNSVSSTTIVACESATVLMLDRKTLEDQLLSHSEICYPLMQIMARAIFSLTRKLEEAAFENVHTRLARLLLHKTVGAKGNPPAMNILANITHADLAQQVGVNRETISRVLADFKRHGLIQTGYRSISVRDTKGLMSYVEDFEQS